MEKLFNEQQRQSLLSVLIFAVNHFRTLMRQGLALLFLVFFMLRRFIENPFYLISSIIILLVLTAILFLIYAYYQYKNFVFYIDYENEEFHLSSGVFQKKDISFYIHQIQQVYIERKWMQRLLGLSAIKIEVAGASSETISLNSLSHGVAAVLLKEFQIIQKQKQKIIPPPFRDNAQPIIEPLAFIQNKKREIYAEPEQKSLPPKIPFKTLKVPLKNILKNAVVTRILQGLLLLFVPLQFIGYDFLMRIFDFLEEHYSFQIVWGPLVILAFLLSGVLLSVLLNTIRSLLMHFNLKLEEVEKGQYQLSQGLINLKVVQIKPQRIQMVQLEQNYLQRKMQIYTLIIRQLKDLEEGQANVGIRIPGITQKQLEDLVNGGFIPDFQAKGKTLQPLKRKFWIHTLFFTLINCVFLGITWVFYPVLWMPLLIVLLPIWPLGIFWMYKKVKTEQFRYTLNQVWHQKGIWKRVNTYFYTSKVQSFDKQHYFWQKRFLHAHIFTAASVMRLTYYPQNEWKVIQRELLEQLEQYNPKWF